jgi:hypothetical protein
MNFCTLINAVWYSRSLWTYIQVLFESLFCFIKLLHIVMVQNFEVMLGQTLNHSVLNSVVLCNVLS